MKIKSIFILFLVGLLPLATKAQCKSFVKKCLPGMSPYTHNGQVNVQKMAAGEKAELEMTFYAGQNYRILLGAEETLGKFQMKLMDEDKNVLYDNTGSHELHKDFKVESTISITIEITVPKVALAANQQPASGCISLLVGFKQQPPTGKGGF